MKVFLNTIGFILIFCIIFFALQPVFIVKDDSGISVAQFYNEPADSLDVFLFGSSGMRSTVIPAVLWNEYGIASYNFAMNGMDSAPQYYLLNEALRFHSPSVVIVSGEDVFREVDFDEEGDEARFRQVLDNMRWSSVKLDSVRDITANSQTQSFMDYVFPLLRFHTRRNITAKDFDFSYKRQRNLHMGTSESSNPELSFSPQTRQHDFFDIDTAAVIQGRYLTKMIDLCKQRGIEVIMLNTPVCREDWLITARQQMISDYAAAHDIRLIDFNAYELFNATGLDLAIDFYDDEHVNISGATKISEYLAHYLDSAFNIPDRRGGPYDPHWDDVVDFYFERLDYFYSLIG